MAAIIIAEDAHPAPTAAQAITAILRKMPAITEITAAAAMPGYNVKTTAGNSPKPAKTAVTLQPATAIQNRAETTKMSIPKKMKTPSFATKLNMNVPEIKR